MYLCFKNCGMKALLWYNAGNAMAIFIGEIHGIYDTGNDSGGISSVE